MSLRFPARDPLAHPEPLIRRVYAYVAYRLGDGPEAEDVTSEVFERALRYRSSYDREKGEPIGWLLGIARRCTSAALASRTAASPEQELVHEEDGRDAAEESIQRLALAAAVAQLRERDQELISLRYGADLTAAQIAQTLDLEKNAVEVALHRALGRLRTIMENEAPGPRENAGAKRALTRISPL
jgi:RNA polymerase sigma-70 factor (ECF subfamily)